MSVADSALDPTELARARALLARQVARESIWPALAAAAALAVSALCFASLMVLAPPPVSDPVAAQRGVP